MRHRQAEVAATDIANLVPESVPDAPVTLPPAPCPPGAEERATRKNMHIMWEAHPPLGQRAEARLPVLKLSDILTGNEVEEARKNLKRMCKKSEGSASKDEVVYLDHARMATLGLLLSKAIQVLILVSRAEAGITMPVHVFKKLIA